MTKRLAGIALTLLCLVHGAPRLHASDAMKAILDSYLTIHAQLAADKTDGIKAAAANIATKAESLGANGAAIAKAAKAIGTAADLAAAREAFGPLSDAVIAGVRADGQNLGDVKVAFCPMNKRSWMQKDPAIKNPYYGTMMSTCGEFKK
jgi:Cu(I)/Ag(I) efflux system membrane fusion protein